MENNFTFEWLGFKFKVESSFEDFSVGDGSMERECTVLEVFGPDGSEISGELAYIYSGTTGKDLSVSVLDLIETQAREGIYE